MTRTALVTGASRGLGKETCKQLEKRGFRVIATSRAGGLSFEGLSPSSSPDPRPATLRSASLELDVTSDASVRAIADRLRREGVSIDVLVNNAGISMKGFDENVARGTLETNFFGPLRVTDALLPLIPDGGNVVMVSSGMGEIDVIPSRALREKIMDPKLEREALVALMNSFIDDVARKKHEQAGWPSSAYSVSKVGLNALVRVLARDLAPRRIRVNAACPGWVKTDMGGAFAERDVATGAASIVVIAAAEEGPTGGFFRDGHAIAW